MENYSSNSNKTREKRRAAERQRKVEKVVSGNVVVKKKGIFDKAKELFTPEDVANAKSYIWWDIIVPHGKKLLSDIVNGILYPGSTNTTKMSPLDRISYNKVYGGGDRFSSGVMQQQQKPSQTRTLDNIVLASRADAVAVLDALNADLKDYGIVSVADLKSMLDLPHDYTDVKYGWTSVSNAQIISVRDGFLLNMPKAMPID